MSDYKLIGPLNLAQLTNVGIQTIKGKTCNKKCLVIPIEDNDIFIKVENKTSKNGVQYVDRKYNLSIEVYERQKPSEYGHTHYIKLGLSKEYVNSHTEEEVKAKNAIYVGDLKPVAIPNNNQAASVEAPMADTVEGSDDDLPF